DDHIEKLVKTIDIRNPFFPAQFSKSGSSSDTFNFNLDHYVDQTLDAEFKIYRNVLGTAMDGIESMLQEPHGCFEQTSSTTYPNVMVMQYLKESGKTKQAIEKKAMKYIRRGYDRLVSFETEEGGFEWFGNTPPHLGLTAFGILEFTEMAKIYNGVDRNMIKRTIDWLLAQRDGKGGFKRSTIKSHAFQGSSAEITNAYVLYAITSAKLNVDVELEFKTVFNEAKKSKDGYRLALAALSAFNLNKFKEANELLGLIQSNINQHGIEAIPVEGTIARSYYNSKQVEAIAFTLMALMKEEQISVEIEKGIEFLLSSRKHGRFGSTQATCTAIQALINYTKLSNAKLNNTGVVINVNGQELETEIKGNEGIVQEKRVANFLKPGPNKIIITYAKEDSDLPYSLNVNWMSTEPASSNKCALDLSTTITDQSKTVGSTTRMEIKLKNLNKNTLGSPIAIIGIPGGASVQAWQLKELIEEKQIAHYELFDDELILYWRSIEGNTSIDINLDLKVETAGKYKATASRAYLYYGDEYKDWEEGVVLNVSS
ncbi:MAG: hypothetical protein AAGK97_01860, partial [Bacteroidota bacterium]